MNNDNYDQGQVPMQGWYGGAPGGVPPQPQFQQPQPQFPQQPMQPGVMPGAPQGYPAPAPAGGGKSKLPLIIGIAAGVVVLAVGGFFLITNLGGSKDNGGTASESNNNSSGNSGGNNSGGNTGVQKAPEEKTINQTITDNELGYTITVKRVVFNIPFDGDDDPMYNEEHMKGLRQEDSYNSLAVEVTVDNHSSYVNSFYSFDLELNINGQRMTSTEYGFDDYIEKNDVTLLPSSTAQGNKSTGWIFFSYEKTAKGDVMFVYDRSEKNATGGTTIPAKKFEIKLK